MVGLSFGGPGAWQQFVAVPETQLNAVPTSVSDQDAAQFYVRVPVGSWTRHHMMSSCKWNYKQHSDGICEHLDAKHNGICK